MRSRAPMCDKCGSKGHSSNPVFVGWRGVMNFESCVLGFARVLEQTCTKLVGGEPGDSGIFGMGGAKKVIGSPPEA